MRTFIITFCLIGSGLIFLQVPGVQDSLMLLFMAGIIPGTTDRISSSAMLFGWSIIGFALIARIIFHFVTIERLARHYMKTKKRLPRRRYSRA